MFLQHESVAGVGRGMAVHICFGLESLPFQMCSANTTEANLSPKGTVADHVTTWLANHVNKLDQSVLKMRLRVCLFGRAVVTRNDYRLFIGAINLKIYSNQSK